MSATPPQWRTSPRRGYINGREEIKLRSATNPVQNLQSNSEKVAGYFETNRRVSGGRPFCLQPQLRSPPEFGVDAALLAPSLRSPCLQKSAAIRWQPTKASPGLLNHLHRQSSQVLLPFNQYCSRSDSTHWSKTAPSSRARLPVDDETASRGRFRLRSRAAPASRRRSRSFPALPSQYRSASTAACPADGR